MASMRALTSGFVVLLVLAAAVPANAGEVIFSIRNGRVTLTAHDAPLSDILAVWEKEGRTTIVARERVQGSVTALEIVDQPEAQALATILRSVTGYIAARRAVAPADASTYRCIVINPVPAPAFLPQNPPADRALTSSPQQMGYPPQSMGYPSQSLGYSPQSPGAQGGAFPPTFAPQPQDTGDDPGGAGRSVPPGTRPPWIGSPAMGIGRPPGDSYAPTPVFPGSIIRTPGVLVPGPQAPGTTAQPGQKPPGVPDRKS